MPDLISEEIEHGLKLLNEGKVEEALLLMRKLTAKEELTEEEKLRSLILEGTCLSFLKKSTESLRMGERAYQEGIRLKKPLLSIDACGIKFGALFNLGRRFEIPEEIRRCKTLLKSTIKEPESEIIQRKALLDYMKGYFLYWKDEYDKALDYFETSLPFFKHYDQLFTSLCFLLNVIGAAYGGKGELGKAVKFYKESLEFTKGNSPMINILIGANLGG